MFQVKVDIENSIGDIRPKIKEEIRQMGKKLSDHAEAIQVTQYTSDSPHNPIISSHEQAFDETTFHGQGPWYWTELCADKSIYELENKNH